MSEHLCTGIIDWLIDCWFCFFSILWGKCSRLFNAKLFYSTKISCSNECKQEILNITSTNSPYRYLIECECGRLEEKCLTFKNRIRRCAEGDIPSRKQENIMRNGCVRGFQRCRKNKKCRTFYEENFIRNCNTMISGVMCSELCETSLMELVGMKKGRKFLRCRCDGSFMYEGFCLAIKKNIKKHCTSPNFMKFLKVNKFRPR